MAINTEKAIQALTLGLIGDLIQPDEYLPLGGGILVDPLPTDDFANLACDQFVVSFGTRQGNRSVEVSVATNESNFAASMAWAGHTSGRVRYTINPENSLHSPKRGRLSP
jgi:hypothetical protein